ncbi:MAG: hypothetical protein M1812_003756 [Candelaria pacifica]|nr:MAG: hypothetical protein M1812_003756 [Candelaria pacifica]
MEDRSKYLQWVRLAERWENDSLLGKGSLPHHIYMLGLAEDSPEEERIRAMFKCGRKSLEQVLKMEDVRLRQMGQIVDVSSEIDGENEKVMGACKEGKEWSHYLGVLQSDISSPMFLGADEGLYRRKMLEIKIAKSKTTPLRKTLRNYNKLQKKEERLVYSWGAMLEKIRAANTSRGDALKDLFAPM